MAVTPLDLTEFDAMLKEAYSDEVILEISTSLQCPAQGLIKEKRKGGKIFVQPIEFDGPTGDSADFTVAKDDSEPTSYEDFRIPRVKSYQFAYMDNETLEASEGNLDAFQPALKETGRVFRRMGKRDARHLFGRSSGSIGQIATGTVLTGATFTLSSWTDAIKFSKGQNLQFSLTDGAGAGTLASGATVKVTKVDLRNGIITTDSADLSVSITGLTDSSFIFPKGDYDLGMNGFADWIPDDRSILSTLYLGVDRSEYEERLAGWYLNAPGTAYDEVLIELTTLVGLNGGMPNIAFMHPTVLTQLLISWQSKRIVDKTETVGRARIGFKGFTVTVGAFEVTLHGDMYCPLTDMYVLTRDTWTKFYAGSGSPHFLLRRRGGSSIEADPNFDRWRSRIGGYRNLSCRYPGANGRATIDAPSF